MKREHVLLVQSLMHRSWGRLCTSYSALGVLALLLCLAGPAGAKESVGGRAERGEEVDHLALATLLLRDGHADRAAAVLSEVDPTSADIERDRYHALSGMVALRRGQHRAAAQHLERAVTRGASKRSTLYLLLARSRFQLGDKRGALTALDAAGAGAERFPGAYLLRAQCHWRLGEHPAAWRALAAGAARHPASREIMQQRVFLLIDLGLYRTATEEGLRYLRGGEAALDDHVAIAQALARAKQHQRAALILEQARLRHPGSRKVTIQLARTYLDAGTPLAAAQILHHASLRFPKLAIEAAELYRRAGKLLRALHLNAQVTDQARKIRQRLGLLVELERFEQAAALQPRLSRLGLLADDNICYALAFSYYRTGRHDEAERLLRRLRDPAAVERAGALRRAMAACAERGWECR